MKLFQLRYLVNVYLKLPFPSFRKWNYLRFLKSNLIDFCDSEGIASYVDLANSFGSPKQIASEYYNIFFTETITPATLHGITPKFGAITLGILATILLCVYTVQLSLQTGVTMESLLLSLISTIK